MKKAFSISIILIAVAATRRFSTVKKCSPPDDEEVPAPAPTRDDTRERSGPGRRPIKDQAVEARHGDVQQGHVEGAAGQQQAARRFGYTPGSFRVLCHAFRQSPHREFFRPPQKGPTVAPKRDRVREQVIAALDKVLRWLVSPESNVPGVASIGAIASATAPSQKALDRIGACSVPYSWRARPGLVW